MRLFHRTSAGAARAILRSGFRDWTGTYMTGVEMTGVWISDVPLDPNEGTKGGAYGPLLVLELDARKLRRFEMVEEGKTYREWFVPAAVLNGAAVHVATEEEEDRECARGFRLRARRAGVDAG